MAPGEGCVDAGCGHMVVRKWWLGHGSSTPFVCDLCFCLINNHSKFYT